MVVHGSEKLLLESQDNTLFKELVTHQELFGASRNVSIAVLNSHTGVSSLLDLDGNTFFQIECDLCLSGSMYSGVRGSCENVETLVSDFVNHFVFN